MEPPFKKSWIWIPPFEKSWILIPPPPLKNPGYGSPPPPLKNPGYGTPFEKSWTLDLFVDII